jgi:hypothetical protein
MRMFFSCLIALLLVATLGPDFCQPRVSAHAPLGRSQDENEQRRMNVPQRGRRVRRDRGRRPGIRSAFKRAGKSAGRGGKRFGQNMGRGRPVRAGKEFGKGMGGFGKHTGKGIGRTMRRVFKP